ncbi:HORMA domain-containing protein [Lipomyces oligophaga]|uniref:HORMA domain-containing protein n=1 Tax=Lipomyces oligophaga TaxID=45792 RepID=UPI0034CD2644
MTLRARSEQVVPSRHQEDRTVVTTSAQSQQFLKFFLVAAFGCLTFLRGIFDDDNFTDDRFVSASSTGISELVVPTSSSKDTIRLKLIKRGVSAQADSLLDWIELGIFDSLLQGYLKAVVFSIVTDPSDPKSVIESYVFSFSYRQDGPIKCEVKEEASDQCVTFPLSANEVRGNLSQMMRRFILTTQHLQPLPDSRHLTVQLVFEESCPEEYQPFGFHDSPDDFRLCLSESSPDHGSVGSLTVGWHALSVDLYSLSPERSALQLRSKELSTAGSDNLFYPIDKISEPEWSIPNIVTRSMASRIMSTFTTPSSKEKSPVKQEVLHYALGRLLHDESGHGSGTQTEICQADQLESCEDKILAPMTETQVLSLGSEDFRSDVKLATTSVSPLTTQQGSSSIKNSASPASPSTPPGPTGDSASQNFQSPIPVRASKSSVKANIEPSSICSSPQILSTGACSERYPSLSIPASNCLCDCGCLADAELSDTIRCVKCSSVRHATCYGVLRPDEYNNSTFLCFQCEFPTRDAEGFRQLAMFRRVSSYILQNMAVTDSVPLERFEYYITSATG